MSSNIADLSNGVIAVNIKNFANLWNSWTFIFLFRLKRINRREQVNCPLILQATAFKRLATTADVRYKIVVSDGVHYTFAVLSIDDSRLIESDELTDMSIIRVDRFALQPVKKQGVDW